MRSKGVIHADTQIQVPFFDVDTCLLYTSDAADE